MRPFIDTQATDPADAFRAANVSAPESRGVPPTSAKAQFLAGGTTMLDLMKLDSMRPERLIDINALDSSLGAIEAGPLGLRLGALVRMSQAADDPHVIRDYPVISQSLNLAASAQIRNMARLGGNVLQRTRCQYFRDATWVAGCNKRVPGSGCLALEGLNRLHAVLGGNDRCIASYPGDFAQALVALGTTVHLTGPRGSRDLAFEDLHLGPDRPEVETVLVPDELITGFTVPAGLWTRRSLYLKIRDRESYEFGLATAAVALHLDGSMIKEARIGLGGVAYKPWRSHEAEAVLRGQTFSEDLAHRAATAAFAAAKTHGQNDYKPELGRRTLVRALVQAAAMEVPA